MHDTILGGFCFKLNSTAGTKKSFANQHTLCLFKTCKNVLDSFASRQHKIQANMAFII